MTVSFDFDGTLSRIDVQEFAVKLKKLGINILITTARYDDENKHLYPVNPTNDDLYSVAKKIGIPKENINFMNMGLKADFLETKKEIIWHIDDDEIELKEIKNRSLDTKPIDVKNPYWKAICNKYLAK